MRLPILMLLLVSTVPTTSAANGVPGKGLSGEWKGTLTRVATGDCRVDAEPTPISMDWVVTKSGTIMVETVREHGSKVGEVWQGQVTEDLEVTLVRTRAEKCDREEQTSSTTFKGQIEEDEGTYYLEMQADEKWCPLENCSARARYEISRPSGS